MPTYLAPGVYVEEVSSGIKPIAGVGTNTAGFIGVVPLTVALSPRTMTNTRIAKGDGTKTDFEIPPPETTNVTFEVDSTVEPFTFYVNGAPQTQSKPKVEVDTVTKKPILKLATAPPVDAVITGSYVVKLTFAVQGGVAFAQRKPALCTNFKEFTDQFGEFSLDSGQRTLAHAVYGFFNNGGTRCWVAAVEKLPDIAHVLNEEFARIDEIALVAAPGITNGAVQTALLDHCENEYLQDRFAILDGERLEGQDSSKYVKAEIQKVRESSYGAIYFPWIQVFDPITKAENPQGNGYLTVPPSGHIAGVYARVDNTRGVHKAPANEAIRGALDVEHNLSRAHQAGLNPEGVNVIRKFDGTVKIYGARTLITKTDPEWTYINVRRLFLYLRESIDESTQWVVFEPNGPDLWAKIRRNVTAFLTMAWRDGALFGATPEQAFYVKCDAETNPSEVRDLGQCITEIGVAPVKPAEFVIFRISQWAGPAK